MSWLQMIKKKVFGTRYASFVFGYDHRIRKIKTAKDGTEYCYYCDTVIRSGTRDWMEL